MDHWTLSCPSHFLPDSVACQYPSRKGSNGAAFFAESSSSFSSSIYAFHYIVSVVQGLMAPMTDGMDTILDGVNNPIMAVQLNDG